MDRDTGTPGGDRDGVRVYTIGGERRWTPRAVALAALAAAALGITAVVALRRESPAPAPPRVATPPPVERRVEARPVAPLAQAALEQLAAARRERAAAERAQERAPEAETEAARTAGAEAREEQRIERLAREVIDALIASGETEGLAAFPPPGTFPPLTGLVVPEDFELPEGYVRHYQTTDDGRQLEPILMFSPHHQFVDARGEPVTLPESLVVPPEMAPAGMPQRVLELPGDPRRAGAR
jgi:hypothetical protein